MFPEPVFVDLAVFGEQGFQLFGLVARVPARQRNAVVRVDLFDFLRAEREARRTVFERLSTTPCGSSRTPA